MMIRGMGHALPSRIMTNADFEKTLDTSDEWIRTRSGIRERRIAEPGENTLTLATAAARAAIADAGLTPADIDLIVLATCTPAYQIPSTACFVQAELGCRQIPAFDLSAACSGFVYALITATSLMTVGGYGNVLVIGAETMSAMTDFEDRGTCVLVGEGAVAALIGPEDNPVSGIYDHLLGADGTGARMIWMPAGGSAEPASLRTVNERLHYMKMRGREVYKFAVTKMIEVIQGAMQRGGLTIDEIAMVIPHQSNLRIIESAAQKLAIPAEKVAVNIDKYGNTSAASIPLAMEEAWRGGRIRRGDWVIIAGFGAGLTWGTALIRL